MKKICIIADCVDDQYAGIYTYATELIHALEKIRPADMEITYIHYKENPFFHDKKELLIPLGKKFPGRSTIRKFFSLPKVLRNFGFHVVHDLYHIAPFPFQNTPYKKVLTIHDISAVLFPEFHVPQGYWIQRYVLPLMIRNADRIITVSEYTKSEIERYYHRAKGVISIPLATRVLPVSTYVPEEKNYILYVGTIEPRKNLQTLITAFEKLKSRGYTGSLLLIGKKGWKCAHIFEMIKCSAWKKDIIWKGYVSTQELDGYYKHAKVFVYPSLYEGFGLPVLEAMNYGVPVIVAWNSSLKEVVGDAGLHFQSESHEELFKELFRLILSPNALEEQGIWREKSKKRSELFSWEKTAKKTIDVYEKLLNTGKK